MKLRLQSVKNYIFLHSALFLYSLCGIASKAAAGYDFFSFPFLLLYGLSIFGLMVYAVLWQQVLKRMDLTHAFMNKAVVLVWGILWGVLLFEEHLTWNMLVGAAIVMVGVCIAGASDGN